MSPFVTLFVVVSPFKGSLYFPSQKTLGQAEATLLKSH